MKKFMKKLLKKTEGFTLVELIVVIAILGILAGVAIPAYSGYIAKAEEAKNLQTLSAVYTAAAAATATDEDGLESIVVNGDTVTINGVEATTGDDFYDYFGDNDIDNDLKANWNNTDNVWEIGSLS